MEWRKVRQLLAQMINGNLEGTETLYARIPFFLRTRLSEFINKTEWVQISEGCLANDDQAIRKAQLTYSQMLDMMEMFICQEKNKLNTSDIAVMMREAKNRVQAFFQGNAVQFATEMANCLQREKELLYLHSASYETEPDNIPFAPDNYMIPETTDANAIIRKLQHDTKIAKICLQNLPDASEQSTDSIASMIPNEEDFYRIAQGINSGENVELELDAQMAASLLENSMQWTSATVESHFLEKNRKEQEAYEIRNKVIETLQAVTSHLDGLLTQLEKEIADWHKADAKMKVKTGPKVSLTALVINFKEFASLLELLESTFDALQQAVRAGHSSAVHGELAAPHQLLKKAEERYFKCCLVVEAHPKDVINIANKASKDSKDSDSSKKETNFYSNKNQSLNTKVRILGGESFSKLCIRERNVELVAERDLAAEKMRAEQGAQPQAMKQEEGKSPLKLKEPEITQTKDMVAVEWNDMELQNFSRVEQNTVYKQFFRIRYWVKVEVHGTEYLLETLSLPFMFKTGSNQLLEFIGAMMWYCSNADLCTGSFTCPDQLPVETVINMLDNRITFATNKRRQLNAEDKAFLISRLPVNENGEVSMQGFIKAQDGGKNAKKSGSEGTPSFYSWFHGVVTSIEKYLSKPWEDGVIYGFCSAADVDQKLLSDDVPEGTTLFRPSTNKLESGASRDANTALIISIKARTETGFAVMAIPLFRNFIEKNGFYRAVKGIKDKKGQRLAKFLYGCGGNNKSIDALSKYVKEEQNAQYFQDYKLMVEQVETMSVRFCNSSSDSRAPVAGSDTEEQGRSGPKKRRYPPSSSPSSPSSSSGKGQSSNFPGASPSSASQMTYSASNRVSTRQGSSSCSLALKTEPTTPVSVNAEETAGLECHVVDGREAVSPDHPSAVIMEHVVQTSGPSMIQSFGNIQVDLSNVAPTYSQEVIVSPHGTVLEGEARTQASRGMSSPEEPSVNHEENAPFCSPTGSSSGNGCESRSVESGNYSPQHFRNENMWASSMQNAATAIDARDGMMTTSPPHYVQRQYEMDVSAGLQGNVPTVLSEACDQRPQHRRPRRQTQHPQPLNNHPAVVTPTNLTYNYGHFPKSVYQNHNMNSDPNRSPTEQSDEGIVISALSPTELVSAVSRQNSLVIETHEVLSQFPRDPIIANAELNENLELQLQLSEVMRVLQDQTNANSLDSGISGQETPEVELSQLANGFF